MGLAGSELSGSVAVVTGAASGMGLASVHALLGVGMRVFALDLRQQALDEALSEADRVVTVALDISDSGAVNEVFERVAAEDMGLRVLVNAAGVSVPSRERQAWVDEINNEMIQAMKEGRTYYPDFLSGVADEDFTRVMEINVNGSFYMIRAAAPLMRRAGCGSIVNFASVAGQIGLPMPAYYPASKAAVVGMTKAIAAELAPYGIRVNALAPAGINTTMLNASGDDHVQALLALQPLKRIAEPEEVGRTIRFLASEDSAHYTGQTLSPSGGALMV